MRAALHLVQGLLTIACVFPIVPARRERLIRSWSAKLLRIFAMDKHVDGELASREHGLVLVANHLSWMDIFVINAIQPARFIAKDELARWPMVGWLIRGVGTLFIDRSSRRHLHEANHRIAEVLAAGDVVAIFPEGTVGPGELQRFHGSLLQPVIDQSGVVQALAIRYRDAHGGEGTSAHYADRNFLQSLWAMTGEPALQVAVVLGPPVHAGGGQRRDLAARAEAFIRQVLA